jgi:predicted kinase
MARLYMLIGVPGSGKSTWRKQFYKNNQAILISTDDVLDDIAKATGQTYNAVFKDNIKFATSQMEVHLRVAIENNMDIVWDQTNLTRKSRTGKLAKIPDTYEKIAVLFPTPEDEEWQRRLASRPGKTIPQNILMGMKSSMEFPDPEEGFDRIEVVGGEE